MTASGGWFTDDLRFGPASGPPDYDWRTDGPVQYVTVAGAEGVLGYLWAADPDDAAGWVARVAAGRDAVNAGVAWNRRLRAPKAAGLPPSQALVALAGDPGNPAIGRVLEGPAVTVASLSDLVALAALA